MRHQKLDGTTWLLAFSSGEQVVRLLTDFAAGYDVRAADFRAVGAFRRATVAFYDLVAKRYEEHVVDEQVEVCSLLGNVSRFEDEVRIHAHVVLGRRDLSTIGGHLVEAEVGPTLELFLHRYNATLDRAYDESVGLPLL